ncbi:MAG: acyl carrier protein [Lautropia sp.]|nr:acyl carrier protein [Lautropia sp.]
MTQEEKGTISDSKKMNAYLDIAMRSVSEVLKIKEADVRTDSRLYDFGMSSMDAFKLQSLLEAKTGVSISGEVFSDLELDVNGLVAELLRCCSKD